MDSPHKLPPRSSRVAAALWLLAYLAVMGAVVGGMLYGRRQAQLVYGTGEAQTDWDAWREGAKQLAGEGPVKRRPPQSAEPPALVLMRDHFAACLGLALVLTSILFGTFMFFIRGALATADPSRP
jgi:hypothetical protein